MLSHVLNTMPFFTNSWKLSYENQAHKIVYNADLILAIPKGQKCFAWFTNYENKNVCILIHMNGPKATTAYITNCCFSSELVYGTVLYGTKFNGNCFSIEDVFLYKGRNVMRTTWESKFSLLDDLLTNNLKQVSFNKNFTVFGMPVFGTNYDAVIKATTYPIYHVQFRRWQNVNNSHYFIPRNEPNKNKTNIQNINRVSKQVREAVFLVRPDVQNDIYHLFYDTSCVALKNDADKKESLLEHDVAGIPDYKTSVMMNRLFRNIKENQNLDTLEESDDEDDEATVFIEREIRMKCVYNNKYKKWCPLADTKEPITKNILIV
jgi:hypothetical protein